MTEYRAILEYSKKAEMGLSSSEEGYFSAEAFCGLVGQPVPRWLKQFAKSENSDAGIMLALDNPTIIAVEVNESGSMVLFTFEDQ